MTPLAGRADARSASARETTVVACPVRLARTRLVGDAVPTGHERSCATAGTCSSTCERAAVRWTVSEAKCGRMRCIFPAFRLHERQRVGKLRLVQG